jgi:hypothetical protein
MVPPGSLRPVVALRETLTQEEPVLEAREASMQEMPSANGTSLGAASIEVDDAVPQPRDDTEGSLWDLAMCRAGIGVPVSAATGNAAPTYGPSGAAHPGVSRLLLPGSPGFLTLPIDGRWVEDNTEFVFS